MQTASRPREEMFELFLVSKMITVLGSDYPDVPNQKNETVLLLDVLLANFALLVTK